MFACVLPIKVVGLWFFFRIPFKTYPRLLCLFSTVAVTFSRRLLISTRCVQIAFALTDAAPCFASLLIICQAWEGSLALTYTCHSNVNGLITQSAGGPCNTRSKQAFLLKSLKKVKQYWSHPALLPRRLFVLVYLIAPVKCVYLCGRSRGSFQWLFH